jgi:hypothetical protein
MILEEGGDRHLEDAGEGLQAAAADAVSTALVFAPRPPSRATGGALPGPGRGAAGVIPPPSNRPTPRFQRWVLSCPKPDWFRGRTVKLWLRQRRFTNFRPSLVPIGAAKRSVSARITRPMRSHSIDFCVVCASCQAMGLLDVIALGIFRNFHDLACALSTSCLLKSRK